MKPGEIIPSGSSEIELNAGRPTVTLTVANTGDRPVQVGSHYHFFETNTALAFDREQARGMRLDIPAGTAVRFEPPSLRTKPTLRKRSGCVSSSSFAPRRPPRSSSGTASRTTSRRSFARRSPTRLSRRRPLRRGRSRSAAP